MNYVSTGGLRNDDGITLRHRRTPLLHTDTREFFILEIFDHGKSGSGAWRILRRSASQARSFSLNSGNSVVAPPIGTVKTAVTPNASKSLTTHPTDRLNCYLALVRNKPNPSCEVRVHSIPGCEEYDRDTAETDGSGAIPSLPP